jgi:hypothetical protein
VEGGVLAGEFELLDDVGDLFAGDEVLLAALVVVAEDEEGGAFEEDGLAAEGDVTEGLERVLDELVVGDKQLHDLRPGLVQRLVPDAGREVLLDPHLLPLRHLLDLPLLLLDLLLPLLERHLVDLVDQHEDVRVFVVLLDAAQGKLPVLEALLEPLPVVFNLEDVDEDFHAAEDGLLLHEEVLLHEGVLPAAVPQVERQRAHELELVLLPLHGVADLLRVLRREVRENHRVHRRLARARVPHQKHLLHRTDMTKINIPHLHLS